MNRRTRIVCKPVLDKLKYNPHVLVNKQMVWQEVYTSPYRQDCVRWIERQKKKGSEEVFKIFVEEPEPTVDGVTVEGNVGG